MSASLDERYFDWLYSQVCSVRVTNPSKTYRNLFHILYTKEYVWLVPNDDNRMEDGRDLRYEFLEHEGIDPSERDKLWLDLDCSMLEFLIALARRLEFITERPQHIWFWELLENLQLEIYNDRVDIPLDLVDKTLERVIWRTYDYNGGGGLFPLVYPEEDQRRVEIWYQISDYLLERGDIF